MDSLSSFKQDRTCVNLEIIVGLANKNKRTNRKRANERVKSKVISLLSSTLSPFYRGGGRGGSLLCPSVGFVFTKMPLGATNGPRGVCIYKNATKGYKRPLNITLLARSYIIGP